MTWCLPNQYFLSVALLDSRCMTIFFDSLWIFSHVFNLFGFCFSLSVPITLKSFCNIGTQLFICPRAFSIYLWVEFSFVNLEIPAVFALVDFVSIFSKSPFFRRYSFYSSLHVVLSELSAVMCLSFHPNISLCAFPSLAVTLVTVSLPVLLVEFSIQVLYFCSGSSGKHQFHKRRVSLQHKVPCLVQWCCSLVCLAIIFFPFGFYLNFFPNLFAEIW